MEDLVSVVIPVFNGEKVIDQCLSSILTQTHQNIEILIVDDCSKDNTIGIVETLSNLDERVKLVRQPINMGVSAARNRGIEEASGKYICFVDCDDWCENDYIESMLRLFDDQVCMVSCGFKYETRSQKHFAKRRSEKKIYTTLEYEEIFSDKSSWGVCWNKMFRADLLKKQSFDTSLAAGEDLIFMIKFFADNPDERVVHTSKKLYHYIKTKGSASGLETTEVKFLKHIKVVDRLEEIKEQSKDENLAKLIDSWVFLMSLQYAYQASKLNLFDHMKKFKQKLKANLKNYREKKHIYSSFRRQGILLYHIIMFATRFKKVKHGKKYAFGRKQ